MTARFDEQPRPPVGVPRFSTAGFRENGRKTLGGAVLRQAVLVKRAAIGTEKS
jgi:hypothetical protein